VRPNWTPTVLYPARAVVPGGRTGASQIGLICTQSSGEITNGATEQAGTRAPGALSALTVHARDAHRALPGVATPSSPIAKSLTHGRSCS